jgi:hypothetical protein
MLDCEMILHEIFKNFLQIPLLLLNKIKHLTTM